MYPSLKMSTAATTLFTCGLAFAGGKICLYLGLPAPYLLGSVFGVWLTGGCIPITRKYIGISSKLRSPVVLMMGIVIGAMFSPDTFALMDKWIGSIFSLLIATILATFAGCAVLVRYRGYPKPLAMLCCLPGGQTEIVAISNDYTDKDYVVALCHLIRVTIVFLSIPLLLTLTQGQTAVDASNHVLQSLPALTTLSISQLSLIVITAVSGYLAALLIRLPIPHLLGPLLLSAGLHVFEIIAIERPRELVIIAQVVIGAAVGSKLAQVPFRQLSGYLWDAIINAIVTIFIFAICAWLSSLVFDTPTMSALLSFSPGGVYEVTLLTILFGFDVAFVSLHHTLRVLLIFLSLPLLLRNLEKATPETENATIKQANLSGQTDSESDN